MITAANCTYWSPTNNYFLAIQKEQYKKAYPFTKRMGEFPRDKKKEKKKENKSLESSPLVENDQRERANGLAGGTRQDTGEKIKS